MKILVTGGAGYIGSILVPQLLRQHHVTMLDSLLYGSGGLPNFYSDPHLQFTTTDVRNAVIPAGTDAVVHLAALRMRDCPTYPEQVQAVNVEATKRLFEAALRADVKCFIFASSCSVYGKTDKLVTEESSLDSLSPYAESKVTAEKLLLSASGDIRLVILRFASAYGVSPNMRYDLLLNGLVLDAMIKHHLEVWGADTRRALVHVRDIAAAIVQCLNSESWHGVINVGGHNRRKRELVDNLGIAVEYSDVDQDLRDYAVDFSKIRALGFLPSFTPEQGLREITEVLKLNIIQGER